MNRPAAAVLLIAAAIAAVAAGCNGDVPGTQVKGPGYEAELPEGWSEAQPAPSASGPESVWARDAALNGTQPNVSVARVAVPPGANAAAVANQSLSALRGLAGAGRDSTVTVLGKVADTTLGGEPAASYDYLNKAETDALEQRNIIVVRGAHAYSVTLTAAADGVDEVEGDFDRILSSWSWEASG